MSNSNSNAVSNSHNSNSNFHKLNEYGLRLNPKNRGYKPFPTTPRGNKTSSRILRMIRGANDYLENTYHEWYNSNNNRSKQVRNKMNAETLKNEIMHGVYNHAWGNNTGFRVDPRRSGRWFRWPTNSELNHWMTWQNWKNVELKKLPNEDPVSLNSFRYGSKAVKVTWKAGNKHHHAYFTPSTIAGLVYGMSENNRKSNTLVMKAIEEIRHKPAREKLFKNPIVPNHKVRRGDIRFVILKKKSPSPAMRRKLAANAANKRAAASKTRGIPASKRKRSPNKSSRRTVKR